MATTSSTSATSAANTSGIVTSDAAISSLGLGSGVLTSSVITQLEAADRTATVTPIENKITENTQKQSALAQLSTLTSAFQTSVYSLQSSSAYQNRTVTGTNSGVNVTASSGVSVQNFSIADTKMATTNVMQSGSFSSPTTDKVANGDGTLNININGGNYKIDYDSSTTYSQLAQKINDAASTDLTASILQTGTNAYSLVLNSKNTGKAQEISLTDLSGNLKSTLKNDVVQSGSFNDATSNVATGTGTMTINVGSQSFHIGYDSSTTLSSLADAINNDPSASADVSASVTQDLQGKYHLTLTAKQPAQGQTISIADQTTGGTLDANITTTTADSGTMTDIQSATDASFKYNGIALTRPTNTITDIIPGVTINLLENNANANIGITEDNSSVSTALSTLVSSYNALNKQIGSMTLTDSSSGTTALFSGNYAINNMKTEITSILSSVNSSGQSLANYGISFNRDGTLSFDSSAFTTQMQKDPDAMANFFSGSTKVDANQTVTTTPGVFTNLYNSLKDMTSSSGTLSILSNQLTTQNTEYKKQETNALSLLSSKYATMTQSFTQYDTLINTFTTQFASLKQQIEASVKSSS